MKATRKFLNQPPEFWAYIKLINQKAGYTDRGTGQIKIHTIDEIKNALTKSGLKYSKLIDSKNNFTPFGKSLNEYEKYRSKILRDVKNLLMNASQAEIVFKKLKKTCKPKCPLPLNKQKGDKKKEAFLTGIVNMIFEKELNGLPVNYDPKELTSISKNGELKRTLSRRVDGAFPDVINPIAVWEIKEYYYTTTFGSRVADGVYESMLDGFELKEIKENLKIKINHILIVDGHYTWWVLGKSYLCRIIDMLHMGYLTDVLFGKEVLIGLPKIVNSLKKSYTNVKK